MRWPSLLWVALLAACAHSPKSGEVDALRPVAETFHQRIRWRDFRGAAELIVPERRAAFVQARRAQNDDKDLSITDYQLEDARLAADGLSARVVSRVSWVRLPSVSENSATVTSEFVFHDGAWLLARQDAGPFVPELDD